MRYRIRDGFLELCSAVSAWYRGVCGRFRQGSSGRTEVIKGTASRVIVVKSPDPGIFREAFFILRDDYFSNRGISQEELLRQAQRSAEGYVSSHLPQSPPRPGMGRLLLLLAAVAAAVIILLKLFGL